MPRLLPSTFASTLLVLAIGCLPLAPASHAAGLETFRDVTLIPTEWADGDSFRVRFPDGKEHTLRLYGADCVEWHVTDSSDARRLRAQRRYFGISDYGGSPQTSIQLAKDQGAAAGAFIGKVLSKPFTVHTAFADGRGDSRYSRIYAFVETAEGRDLATLLVEEGLARAFGVYRTTVDGTPREDYMEQLKDAELVAAQRGKGIWKFTDWEVLPEERRAQRREEAEEDLAMGSAPPSEPLDVNSASRSELTRIPGVGEVTANRIIEGRPYQSLEDLLAVNGIGPATLKKIRPYLFVK